MSAEPGLYLTGASALRFDHRYGHVNCGQRHAAGKEPESYVRAPIRYHDAEAFGHHKHAQPVGHDRERHSGGSDIGHEELAHHQPWYGSVAHRKGNDEQHHAQQRQPADMRDILAALLHVKVGAQYGQANGHHGAAEEQQYLAASPFNEQR